MTVYPRINRCRRASAFTIVELSVAVSLSLGIAGTILMLMSQHMTFLRFLERGRFLKEEVPTISLTIGRFVGHADSYLLFSNKSDAIQGSNAITTGGSALLLQSRDPSGSIRKSIVAFESGPGGGSLNIYNHNGVTWGSTPSWAITSAPANVTFSNSSGILLTTIVGPNGEEITYGGNSQ